MPQTHVAALQALLMFASCGFAGPAAAASFNYETLNPGGSPMAYPYGINKQDQVVGTLSGGAGFVWSGGQLTTVSGAIDLYGVNDAGIAVGIPSNGSDAYASYNISTGQLSYIPVPKKGEVAAYGINDAGDVTGIIDRGRGGSGDLGFYSVNGIAITLEPPHEKSAIGVGINKAGDIIIRNGGEIYYNPFIYHKKKFTQFAFPGASMTVPIFIADSGAVGGAAEIDNVSVGFVFDDGSYVSYSPPGSTAAEVTGIGPSGQVVGYFDDASGASHGFEEVGGLYYQIDVPGALGTTLVGVSSSGSIFGSYSTSMGTYAYIATCRKKAVCTQ